MILPIFAYGSSVLKEKCKNINNNYPDLKNLIHNMFETMYTAKGVGLAAPQIGQAIRLFILDTTPFSEDEELEVKSIKKIFINPKIIHESGEIWSFNEGCLSIPDIREDINRRPKITITYEDQDFNLHTEDFDGILARVIQHEYDHIEGVLFTDKLPFLRKRMLKNKLQAISKGDVDVDYLMDFPE